MAKSVGLLVIGFVLLGLTMVEFQDLGFDLASIIPFPLNLGFAVASIIPFSLSLFYVSRRERYKTEHVYFRPNEKKSRWKKKSSIFSELKRNQFARIKFDFDNELEALFEIKYKNPTQSKVRLFFGREGNEIIYSRDYIESSKNNFVHIKIFPSRKQNSTQWIKKGVQDVGDNFEAGYTIEVLLRDAEPKLRKYLIDVLRSRRFGCLPAERTIHAHFDEPHPTEYKAEEILKNILDEISRNSFD